MWMIVTEADQKAYDEAWKKQWEKSLEAAKRKSEARDAHIKAGTCPHCGQCPPLPPWLY